MSIRLQFFNRLWVRFALSIVAIVFIVNVLPLASWLIFSEQEIALQTKEYVVRLDTESAIGLSDTQIDQLGESLAEDFQIDFSNDILFLLSTTIIVGVLAGALLGRRLSLPFERMVTATQAIASHNLSHRVNVHGAQEIQELAHNFNQMAAELDRSERLRRNMMADVSHELLTPMTVLQGNLRAILDDVYELNKDEIATLYEQNKHLIRLVKDLRQLAQVEAGQLPLQLDDLNLSELAKKAALTFTPIVSEKNIALHFDLASNLPSLQVDADRLRQVLHNLISNAVRHTPKDGEIRIQTQLAHNEIWLSITDSGDGIPLEFQRNLFDRFYRTDDSRRRDSGGAGLGLAISKAIIEAHGGRITASSLGEGKGATFTIYLPLKS